MAKIKKIHYTKIFGDNESLSFEVDIYENDDLLEAYRDLKKVMSAIEVVQEQIKLENEK